MSGQQALPVVDVEQLRRAIDDRLRDKRDTIGQVIVDRLWLEDAAWRAAVKPAKSWPDGYALVLAEIEESLFDESGVNVMLVPTSP